RDDARRAADGFDRGRKRLIERGVGKLIDWMRENEYATAGAKATLRGFLLRAFGDKAAELDARVKQLSHNDKKTSKREGQFEKRFEKLVVSVVARPVKLAKECMAAGEVRPAFRLYASVLQIDPMNEDAHKAFGHKQVKKLWFDEFHAKQYKKGLVWDARLGWIIRKDRARYAKGEVWDPTDKGWRSLAAANTAHAALKDPWRIETSHFEISATVPLDRAVMLAGRLEALLIEIYLQFPELFPDVKKGRVLPASSKRRHKVWFYANPDQLVTNARDAESTALWHYSEKKKTAHFFPGMPDFDQVLQGVVTVQIIKEVCGDRSPPRWVAEGVGEYLRYGAFRGGAFAPVSLRENEQVWSYVVGVRGPGKELSFREVLKLVTDEDWEADEDLARRGAAAAFYFLMLFDGGRYRSDAAEFVRDCFRGDAKPISEYLGLGGAALDFLMSHFYVKTVE
ncbi:MAG: hypothetical protein ACYTAF_14205, partial [Planctomycetota bacterium]